ncbi:MAG: lipopolysaccharide kinase InaA family protein [Phycisphaerae bacterium]|nr:lipopolysaccharide kinase InaA family protein [Phycisphaerae bacterium]
MHRRFTAVACAARAATGKLPPMGAVIRWVEPQMREPLAAAGLRDYGDFVDTSLGVIVSQSGTTRTRRIAIEAGGRRETLFLKRYRYAGPRRRWRWAVDKARVEARNFERLRSRCGLNTPDVIAYGVHRRGVRLLDAFLLTRAVEGAVGLDEWPLAPTPPGAMARLMRAVAGAVARMHAAHFYHFDLQWRNLLIRPAGDGFDVIPIDSSRGGPLRTRWGRAHGRMRDLAQLDKLARQRLTRTQRLRWLTYYLGRRRLSAADRALVREVTRYLDGKLTPEREAVSDQPRGC